ncbi:MAG: chloride channel protein [Polyangiales bacterium]
MPSPSAYPSRSLPAQLRFALAVGLTALAAAGFAIAFRRGLHFVLVTTTERGDIVAAMRILPWWLRLLLPAVGGLVAGLIGVVAARLPQEHGVGDVMEAVVLGQVRLSLRVTLLKSLASFGAIVTGGSLGREGPLIQFGGAVGKQISRWLRLPLRDLRRVIAAGTAAGFAAAYNTPLAAVLFVLEVVLGVVVLDTVIPTLVATVVASELSRIVAGEGPIYGQRAFVLGASWELIAFAVLGLLAALTAQGFMRLQSWGERTLHAIRLPYRPALGGLVAGAFVAAVPEVAGNGYEPLNDLIDGELAVGFVLTLLFAKCFATTASVSSGSPGGVFTPTLLIGGTLGFGYGALLHALQLPAGPAPGYALVGMAAAIAATSHAPLMAAVMVFELSGDYAVVLPLAVSTALATAASRAMRRDSIYGAELRARGIGWAITLEGRALERAARVQHGLNHGDGI